MRIIYLMTGKELRERRKKLGVTQEEIARSFNVTPNTVARWERGEVPKSGILPTWVESAIEVAERNKEQGRGLPVFVRYRKSQEGDLIEETSHADN